MSKAPVGPTCWECGAENDPGSSECWLCGRADWNRRPVHQPRRPASARPVHEEAPAIGGWMLLIAVIVVGIGIFSQYPGAGLLLLASLAPALFFTELRAVRHRHWGVPMTIRERVARVIVLMVVIPILLVVALAIGVFIICAWH
jgi:hypothetical protein